MYRSSYSHEVHKEKYERSDVVENQKLLDFSSLGLTHSQGLENLQELNERFANYINRARVLEQRNAIFRKQLETFQRMDEMSGLEEAFEEQIELNKQRIRELSTDRSKLERENKDTQRLVEEFKSKYENECEHQLHLKDGLEHLNKEADDALLRNLELQIQSQFLQDDINAAKERYKKNLMEIQTYVTILQQIIQSVPPAVPITAGRCEDKLLSERRIPILQSQLEEYKNILCQLQAQKRKLQSETSVLEQVIKNTQESYDDEIQLYNDQIENLKKRIEEAEKELEKLTSHCRQLAIYQQSLEHELERYKRIIETEDNRLNTAIVGTPITLFMQCFKPSKISSARGKDITLAIQDIATAKPRQKGFQRKPLKSKEIPCSDKIDVQQEDEISQRSLDKSPSELQYDKSEPGESEKDLDVSEPDVSAEDVPDGAHISKAIDKLCNIVRGQMVCYKQPEPLPDITAKSRYVLVTGESSYLDPFFYSSSTCTGGRVFVSNVTPDNNIVLPIPEHSEPSGSHVRKSNEKMKKEKEGNKNENGKEELREVKTPPVVIIPDSGPDSYLGQPQGKFFLPSMKPCRETDFPHCMTYEKVEVIESIEKFSDENLKSYEETATIVETVIEKTTKK
ncbi:hypothetical protein GDO86_009188 [Hymenochirus boettgeri]|uniref:Filensin n=1 Tax=Hymenochirus boettgeri TaxID=247094 RepID=A0A8T2JHX4_9PIPI|nr:hypothetical protein GDO86_009188 [Hymenochirus boettgeri]